MGKRNKTKPKLLKELTVKSVSPVTGAEEVEEINLNSLTVPELRKKMKDIYGADLSRTDAKRLLNGEEIRIKNVIFPERPAPRA